MKSELRRIILFVAIYWSRYPMCYEKKCQGMRTTVEYHGIISNTFGETSNSARYSAVKAIMNNRMKDESKTHYTYA